MPSPRRVRTEISHEQQRQHPPRLDGRRKDPAYRHTNDLIVRPSSIALKKRSTALPSSRSSPSLSVIFSTGKSTDTSSKGLDGKDNVVVDNDDVTIIKQTKSQDGSMPRRHSGHTYDCNYKHAIEQDYEDWGIERKLVELKQPHLKISSAHQKARGRTGTHPGMLANIPMSKSAASKTTKGEVHKIPYRKKTNSPVDVDEVSTSSDVASTRKASTKRNTRGHHASSKRRPVKTSNKDDCASIHSLPTDAELRREQPSSSSRLDTERLLSQMGMDVTENDYCIEGEFESTRRNSQTGSTRTRCHSYDCNYNTPLELEFEEFGVERKLVEFNKTPDQMMPSSTRKKTKGTAAGKVGGVKKLMRSSLGNRSNESHKHGKTLTNNHDKASKTGILSILRGGNRKNRAENSVPNQIMASTITPSASEDVEEDDCPITPEDMRMLYRWQNARIRSANNGIGAKDAGAAGSAAGRGANPGKKSYEDVLSITSSCGDKTAPIDNRKLKRQHRPGFSF